MLDENGAPVGAVNYPSLEEISRVTGAPELVQTKVGAILELVDNTKF